MGRGRLCQKPKRAWREEWWSGSRFTADGSLSPGFETYQHPPKRRRRDLPKLKVPNRDPPNRRTLVFRTATKKNPQFRESHMFAPMKPLFLFGAGRPFRTSTGGFWSASRRWRSWRTRTTQCLPARAGRCPPPPYLQRGGPEYLWLHVCNYNSFLRPRSRVRDFL